MAQIRKIIRSNPTSSFQNVGPQAGSTFGLLADAMAKANERIAPVAQQEMARRGAEEGRRAAQTNAPIPVAPAQSAAPISGNDPTLGLIREFEGFREGTYWDVNAHRTGYGSDTITDASGNVRRVKKGDRVTREDAERDLSRRVNSEFVPIAQKAIGAERFNSFSPEQQAAVTSIAYNYGKIPKRISGALRSGSAEEAAQAIRSLGGDNNGVNRKRRNREADIFLQGASAPRLSTSEAPPPPTMVQTESGSIEPRLYSPYSGPVLQAYNAAAGVAYNADVLERGAVDLINTSRQFKLDPEGFQQAASGYVEQVVESAPDEFKAEIRSKLERQVTQRFLGMTEEKHKDIERRANNSSKALMDRYSSVYAEAVAAGNAEEGEQALTQLLDVLSAREALPGVAWTREQSENVVLAAEDQAAKIIASQQKKVSDSYKGKLDTIIASAKDGLTAADENILLDPSIVELHPELAAEAQAHVTLRDQMPEFHKMTPGMQKEAIETLRAAPIENDWEIDIIDAATKAAKTNREAWEEDPIMRARQVMENKPPEMPEITMENAGALTDFIQQRVEYAELLQNSGYTDAMVALDAEEAEQLSLLMGKDTDPQVRMAVAQSIVTGAGPAAANIFNQLDADPVTSFGGKMLAGGGKPAFVAEAMRGQQLLDENLVRLPANTKDLYAVDKDMREALIEAFPKGTGKGKTLSEIIDFAEAIYGARAQGVEPNSDDAKEIFAQALNHALGQTKNARGQVLGGVQEVYGRNTLLPIGVSAEKFKTAVQATYEPVPETTHKDIIAMGLTLGMSGVRKSEGIIPDNWQAASLTPGAVPHVFNKPMTPEMFEDESVRLVPLARDVYTMQFLTGEDFEEVSDENGVLFVFNMKDLIEASQ